MQSPGRMVVVDDDSKVRLLLERAFRAPEFETHTFPTGAAALERVAGIRPDCVVSDILMPDMDGEGLLRAMRALPGLGEVPFVAVSAVRSEARIRSVLAAGANAFLLKPFPLRDLIEKVRSLLDRPRTKPEEPGGTSDYTSPTQPVVAMSHTTSTTVPRRREGTPRAEPSAAPPLAPPSVRVSPVRIVLPGEAALICLGDQPQVQERSVRRVCEAFHKSRSGLIVPSYQMRRGHPWLVERSLWDELLELRPPQSPRDFLNRHAAEIVYVEMDTSSILADLDTPQDYKNARPQS